MAAANTISSFQIGPKPIPIPSTPFKLKTTGVNPSLSWVSTNVNIRGRNNQFPCFSIYYIERQRLESSSSCCSVLACLPSSSSSSSDHSSFIYKKTKLFVSGLSFRTTEDSLRNAFQNFGQLVEVNLVMDKIAKRPKGFAFLRYATEEESQKAIEGMHGKVDVIRKSNNHSGTCSVQALMSKPGFYALPKNLRVGFRDLTGHYALPSTSPFILNFLDGRVIFVEVAKPRSELRQSQNQGRRRL